jgi:hypothetical protein
MKTRNRVGAFAFALATGAALFVPFASPASAALTSHVTCAKVTSGKITAAGAKSTFASCTPATLKSGTGTTTKTPPPGTKKGQVGFKITWSGGKGTTTAAIAFTTQKTRGKCPAGYARLAVKGTVKVATGAAKAITKVGEPVTASQCVLTSGPNAGKSQLEPGTKFKL